MIRQISEKDINNLNLMIKNLDDNYIFNEELLRSSFFKCILYEEGQEIKGFLKYSIIYDRMEIDYIFVIACYRNLDIASKMINYILTEANILNLINITLEVNENNESAINLYKKFDFKTITTKNNYYKNESAIVFIKELKK